MISDPAVVTNLHRPASHEEVAEIVRGDVRLLPVGGGTKPTLSHLPAGFQSLSMTALTGIVEYQPSEFTITARAGTPLRDVIAALAENGQYLPWDPPLVSAGATLGGAIGAGLSGSGRYRYGGLRDFLVGIRFVDGQGRIVRGGGKVVKNAAGFDLPKLMVGSAGRLGVLLEATFKVFPQPPAWATVRMAVSRMTDAQQLVTRLAQAPLDLNALDIEVLASGEAVLWLRLGGLANALPERTERLQRFIGGGEARADSDEATWWRETAALAWTSDAPHCYYASLLPSRLAEADAKLARTGASRRYLCGSTIVWVAADDGQVAAVEQAIGELRLPAVRVRGTGQLLFNTSGGGLLQRVKRTLDPKGVFPEWS